MMRIGVPRRGPVVAAARWALESVGLPLPSAAVPGDHLGVGIKLFELPERDIHRYLADGILDLALISSVMIEETSVVPPVALELGLGIHELALFTASERGVDSVADLGGARVATAAPNVVRRHFGSHAVTVDRVLDLDPAEPALMLGIADAVALLVPGAGPTAAPVVGMRRLGAVRRGQLVAVDGRAPAHGRDAELRTRVLTELAGLREARLPVPRPAPTGSLGHLGQPA